MSNDQPTDRIAELLRLRRDIESCVLCPLSKTRINAVPGEGPVPCDVLLIGEGPGAEEDRQGKPFVGAAGMHLDSLLESIGLSRKRVYITNVVKCRPPANRIPRQEEREACNPYLVKQIEILNPKVIVLLGSTALQTVLGKSSITALHGKVIRHGSRAYLPLYHPAAALHNPTLAKTIQEDIHKLKEVLTTLSKSTVDRQENLDKFLRGRAS